jgi:hypothetical protein
MVAVREVSDGWAGTEYVKVPFPTPVAAEVMVTQG